MPLLPPHAIGGTGIDAGWSENRGSDRPGAVAGGINRMLSTQMVRHVLRDEAVTRGLGDIEARMIVEWLADKAEEIGRNKPETEAWIELARATRRARIVSRFVQLWAESSSRGAAVQLISAERLDWPLPAGDRDSGILTEEILAWIDRRDELALSAY